MPRWPTARLGDVCKTGAGGTPLRSKKEYFEDGTIPWLMSGEVANRDITETENFITELGLANSSARWFPADTVLVAMYGATAGQVGILRFRATTNQAVCGILPGEHFVPEFLYYYLVANKGALVSQAVGNAQPNISQVKIKETIVPVPPLAEQRRIVAVLDEAFAAIATATANAEKNLANAGHLFGAGVSRIMAAEFADTNVGALGKIGGRVYTGPFGSLLHKSDYVLNGIPLVNPSHINNGKIVPSEDKCVSSATAERLSSYRMKVGDIVFGRRGEMGRCAVVTEVEGGFLCGTGSFFIRPFGQTDPHYLAHLLRSEAYRKRLISLASGATMPNLSNAALSGLQVELPPLPTQQELVLRVDKLAAETGKVSSFTQRKIVELNALKQSLLHRAFSGELTEREPLAA